MSAKVGSLNVDITLETARFKSGLTDAQRQLAATQKSFASVGAKMTGLGAKMSLGITAPFAALVASAIPAAVESAQALGQVNAALASMGPASGRTSADLVKMAGHLQDISNFDDDDILKSVTANLLTFGNVSGKVFDDAQLAIVNISARMGTDLQSSALMVGKALNDPIKGMKTLSRAGIQFTEDQKDAIRTMVEQKNVAGAQAIMLGELNRQFGGAAKAQRDATPTAAAQQAWRTFQETIGAIALKVLPPLTKILTDVLDGFNTLSPGMQTVVVGAVAVVAAIGPLVAGIGGIVTVAGALLPALVPIGAALAGIATTIVTVAVPALASLVVALSPILIPLGLVTAAVAAVYLTWKHWDKIEPILQNLYTAAKTWIYDKLGAIWTWLAGKLGAVGDAFFKLYDRVVGHSYIPDMVTGIADHIARLDGVMVRPIEAATKKAAEAFGQLRKDVAGILDGLFPDQAKMRQLTEDLAKVTDPHNGQPQDVRDRAGEIIRQQMRDLEAEKQASASAPWQGISGENFDSGFMEAMQQTAQAANDNAKKHKEAAAEIIKSYADMAHSVVDSLRGLVDAIKGGDFFDILDAVAGTVSQIFSKDGGGNSIASTIGGLFKSSGGGSGGISLPGFATGGSFNVGGSAGVDRNMLAINGIPRAMVSATERVTITPANDRGAGAGRPVTFDLRGAVMTADLLQQMELIANFTAGREVSTAVRAQRRTMQQSLARN
ncbi:MAG: phage tail length tape measure family protein [Sphingomonas sp.]